MPKEGFESITIPKELNNQISKLIDESGGIIPNKTQALNQAWQIYEKVYLKEKNPKPVRISNHLIGHNQPVYIVGEIGINHNGNMNICKRMIDMAVNAGCHAVKFQKRTPDICVPEEQKSVIRETPWGNMTYLEYRKKIEFEKEQYTEIDNYCKNKGITWFASVWDKQSIDFMEMFNTPCYKIPSACLTDKELLKKVRSTGKPAILSTGMSTMEQINEAVKILGEENLIILHCTSTYPAKDEELNLNVITSLRKYFNCPIGYSGHENGVHPSIIAATLGACFIERHITINRSMYGSDQAASLEERGLQIICRETNVIKKYLGDGKKRVYESEKPIMNKLRKFH